MAAISINRLTNANVYLGADSLMGQAEEINLPEVKVKTAEHKALGMNASLELPAGLDKMEGKIKWTSFYKDSLVKVANPYATIQVQVRGNLEGYEAQGRVSEVPVVAVMSIQAKNFPGVGLKQQENAEMETAFSCLYYKLTIDGQDVIEVDVLANIHKAGGVDLLANYRTNLGG